MRLFLLGCLVAGAACTAPNPRSCVDGTCTSEEFPFCDVDGSFGGEPQTCIAVTCEPMALEACSGDKELRCNSQGTNYEQVACPLGCVDGIGCRACEPNETVCSNGTVQTCGADGEITSSQTCSALGCYESEPRCRDVDFSNGMSLYYDMVALAGDLTLDGAVVDTFEQTVTKDGVPVDGVTSFMAPAPNNGSPIFVIVAKNVTLTNVLVQATQATYPLSTGPALAIVASGTLRVSGPLTIAPGAGGTRAMACAGGFGVNVADPDQPIVMGGSGGGGHATVGGKGGDVENRTVGGAGGGVVGNESLIPLRGGCGGSLGGGAIQLSSNTAVQVDGTISVRGDSPRYSGYGGGAGGALLIEAPRVTLGANAKLLVLGGGGAAGDEGGTAQVEYADGSPTTGAMCLNASRCGRGGAGASAGVPASPGQQTVNYGIAGGGGGGLGRIRINTPDQTYSKSSSALEAGALTTGVLATR